MTIVWSNQVDEILKIGCSLDQIGIRNWALTKEAALNALDKLLEIQVPILGGDVFEKINGVMRPKYDNWYCDPILDESKDDFVVRSIGIAKRYIENYQVNYPDIIFFALVPGV